MQINKVFNQLKVTILQKFNVKPFQVPGINNIEYFIKISTVFSKCVYNAQKKKFKVI